MRWIKVKTRDRKTRIINLDAITMFEYCEDINSTVIRFTKPNQSSVCIEGDVIEDIETSLNYYSDSIFEIGG